MGRHVSKAWLLIFLWLLPCWAQELAEWITSLGGFVSPKLEIKEQADAGHGLFANESVQQGETLLSIPFNAIFFGEKAVKLTPCHRRIRDFFDTRTHPENVRTQAIFSIIVFLLQISTDWEARKNWPHLDSLLHHWDKLQHAEHHLRFPLFWTPEMMSEISGTTAFEIYSTARMGVEREYTEVLAMVCPKLASGSSLQSYKHIWTLVNSRVLTFPGSPLDGLPAQPALVPMFDMVNHQLPIPERPLQTEDQVTGHLTKSLGRFGLDPPRRDSQSSSKLHMWLQSSIQSGEEVTDVYGLHSNQEMLWNFGFTVPWIHNLTCLTKVRLSLELQQVQHELPEGGAGFSTDLLRSLQHVLHFEFDGCARSKVSEDSAEQSNQFGIPGLLSIVAFLRAWIASARASLPELHRTCSFASPEACPVLVYDLMISGDI
eukprot:Skav213676  [mRNA]  locus=scaffold491:271567:272856:- [translate_table: standard]